MIACVINDPLDDVFTIPKINIEIMIKLMIIFFLFAGVLVMLSPIAIYNDIDRYVAY